jgi:beta-lactamase regulating signal transducer with metallopeptidase domain
MQEDIARTLYYFEVHLLYASLVCLAAWALTSIRGSSATTRYWIWVATALNFILPLGAVIDRIWTSDLSWAAPLKIMGHFANSISEGPIAQFLFVTWLLGAILMFARLCLRIRAERSIARASATSGAHEPRPSFRAHGVLVRFDGDGQAPAVNGILHPHISLPDGIDQLLSEFELNAVLLHELTHARRHDNLIRLIYELGLCGLWFHPLIWIAGSRLAIYRELSCDESVICCGRGADLVSALAKLANPERSLLLQATASSFLSLRLARLVSPPRRQRRAVSMLLSAAFSAALLLGVFGTVAHTACCVLASRQ